MCYSTLLSCPAVTGHERIQVHFSDAFLAPPIARDVAVQIIRVNADIPSVANDRKFAEFYASAHGLLAVVQDLCGLLHGEQLFKLVHGRSRFLPDFE